ncbi:cytochrome b [Parasaccharibacter sp. TMW 2.1888]|uniref:cytochrome b n=1 Tax=Parasaccharibacter sp. TMW 2.1888 TaxID=2268025 RepID=UPI00204E7C81|nr:cytochrome b/b6 domain-containing protein [Parasaccharibacter sp. TMW 2.1888]UPO79550.1 cytochrome b [Parasaccharibacter sp. TMW 2.1888]
MSFPQNTGHATPFPRLSILLHWVMAVLIIVMLFVGLVMAHDSTIHYAGLFTLHRTVGFLLLLLVVIRLVNRFANHTPALPMDMPGPMKLAAHFSHILLYGFMIALPLVGWAMLSAGGYPITLWGGYHIPPLMGFHPHLWGVLRCLHSLLAYGLILLILAHIGAALLHGIIRRDGVMGSMLGR